MRGIPAQDKILCGRFPTSSTTPDGLYLLLAARIAYTFRVKKEHLNDWNFVKRFILIDFQKNFLSLDIKL